MAAQVALEANAKLQKIRPAGPSIHKNHLRMISFITTVLKLFFASSRKGAGCFEIQSGLGHPGPHRPYQTLEIHIFIVGEFLGSLSAQDSCLLVAAIRPNQFQADAILCLVNYSDRGLYLFILSRARYFQYVSKAILSLWLGHSYQCCFWEW